MKPIQIELPSGLYLVATPIGNARDITLRSLDILTSADVLVSEDTRTTRRLMDIHGISLDGRPLWTYHDHSTSNDRQRIVEAAAKGKSVAYVSEAGTPLIADPGYQLVQDFTAAGLLVTAAPGPSAVINALCLAGLPTDRFIFAGFLPPAHQARKTELSELLAKESTLVIYETAKRLPAFLETLSEVAGPEHIVCLCRELTKKFEQVEQFKVSDLQASIAEKALKGEVVLVIAAKDTSATDEKDIDAALLKALLTMRVKDAADSVAGALGLPRRQTYQRALELKSQGIKPDE